MVIRQDSIKFKALMLVYSPVPWLPALLPLRVEHCRVGDNTADFVKVIWSK